MSIFNWFSSKTKSINNLAKKTVAKVDQLANNFEAKIAHLATDLAYKLAKGEAVYKEHELRTVESLKCDGWKVLCNSSEFTDTNHHGYKAVAFVKEGSKEVLIATAGTVPTDLHDLKDDAYIGSGTFPSKVVQAKAMVEHVTTLLGGNASNYTFNVTGHSLGAVLTDVTAFEIMSKGFNLGTSITFDSPGSKNSINEAIKAEVFSKNVEVSIEDLAEHCVVYNSPHNLVNYNPIVSSPHITNPMLVLPVKELTTDEPIQYIPEPSGILGYINYLVSKVSSDVISTCSNYLGITSTLELITNLPGHSLKNFADLCERPVYDTKGWEKLDGALHIETTSILEKIDSTGTGFIAISNSPIEEDYVQVLEFSQDDLCRALSYNDDNVLLSGDVDFPSLVCIN